MFHSNKTKQKCNKNTEKNAQQYTCTCTLIQRVKGRRRKRKNGFNELAQLQYGIHMRSRMRIPPTEILISRSIFNRI